MNQVQNTTLQREPLGNCTRCGSALGEQGAYYCERARVCRECSRCWGDGGADYDDGLDVFRGIVSAVVISIAVVWLLALVRWLV